LARPGRRSAVGPGILAGVVLAGTAAAQPDLDLKGSLSISGVQDDNLFYTSESRERDVITRLTPGAEAGLRSDRFSLAGRYSLDVERFAQHPELDSDRAREFAAFDLQSRPGHRATLSLHGDYVSTLSPGELNLTTGLAAGRARARRLSVSPSLGWRLGPGTDWSLGYTQTRDDLAGGVAGDTRAAALGLNHRLSPRDTASVGYNYSRYDFEGGAPVAAHTLTLGWDRRFGPQSSLALRAGPRYSAGRFDPEASLALQHGTERLQTSLTFARTLTTVIGLAGTVVTDSVLPAVSFRPVPSLRLSAAPGYYRIRDPLGGPETRVYRVDLEASWRLSDWLSLESAYRRNLQRGVLGGVSTVGALQEKIARNTFFLGLVAGRTETRTKDGGRSAGGPR